MNDREKAVPERRHDPAGDLTPAAGHGYDCEPINRRAGLAAVNRLLLDTSAAEVPLVALWLNVDRFRQVNDSFGHAGGDQFIGCIARRIKACMPARGEFRRMGSHEFVVLLAECVLLDAQQLAHRLLLEIEQPLAIDNILVHPSASIGIALHRPEDDGPALLERADRAMIDARRQGGNRFVVAGHEMLAGEIGVELAREELAIESALRHALENGRLQLNYQPILRPDGEVEAVEALMRCIDNGVHIPPGKFIAVAEKTGLIIRLGEWSLLQGAACAARLRDQGRATKVAINVSRAQLMSPGFLAALHGALACANVAPALIELELTESLFMDLSPTVQSNLRQAREAGVGLAIDDFGTGYSCLASLKDLPATKLKFDRAFISVLPADRRTLSIVKAMTHLAKELGMIVVAEGVETAEQRVSCEVAGIDATQGFIHAYPMTEDELLRWMQARRPS